MRSSFSCLFVVGIVFFIAGFSLGQDEKGGPVRIRGSLVEDRAARKLLQAGQSRYDADEFSKAVEIWESVIERYPRSRVRFDAHLKLGHYFLNRDRKYDQARGHFEAVAFEDNPDEEMRAEATLNMGVCFYHIRNYGKCFQVMRDVIEQFPVSEQVNQAYYYIGLGHFALGHYSRAIEALEKVGTALAKSDRRVEKLEAGKRFFVRVEDADLAVLEPGDAVTAEVRSSSGDVEKVDCYAVGRNVRLALGSIATSLGSPIEGDQRLQIKGDDKVTVRYIDRHRQDNTQDQPVDREVAVVGDAQVAVMDGAFRESLGGVVLGKQVNVQVIDADRDLTGEADQIAAVVEVYRQKTDQEKDAELAKLAAERKASPDDEEGLIDLPEDEELKIDPYKLVDRLETTLVEAEVNTIDVTETEAEGAPGDDALDNLLDASSNEETADNGGNDGDESGKLAAVHSGIFRTTTVIVKSEQAIQDDQTLQAIPGDLVRVTYLDERHTGDGVAQRKAEARALEGNIGGVRVTRASISDVELRIKTQLKTADALTKIGNRYKEFGLKTNAHDKYAQALTVCEDVIDEARRLGGRLLEENYVQLWQIYFEMDRLELAAAMCQRLEREFPNSGFVDDALLQLAAVARKEGDLRRSIGIYTRLVNMQTSQLRGEAQFGVAECYEAMADAAQGASSIALLDRAFQEYKKVYDQFPESGRVGEAVAKMANYYYQQKDYARAIDTFETVLSNYPDAKFLDVILFNYGRCLYRMGRLGPARQKFDQLIGDFPESPLAGDAKQISEALAKAGR